MNTKDFLKIAGVKSEKEFYKKFPTEEAFFEAYPQANMYKKGGKLKKKQQDPAHGYREFPPNVMAMGGGLVNMMQGGGSIPNMPLAQEGMESTAQSGYISPYNESQFNVTNQAKKTGNVMSRGENVGWTIADVVFDFFKPIHGQDVDLSKMTGKVNPYNAQEGSWWKSIGGSGEMSGTLMNKMTGSGQDKGPSQGGMSIQNNSVNTGPNADNSLGSPMNRKFGGSLKMNMGGLMPGMTAVNSPEQFGTSLRQYGGFIDSGYNPQYISPYSESQYNKDNIRMRPSVNPMGGRGHDVLAMFYGMGEGMLDTITAGMTDQLTDEGFKALQNMQPDTERQRRNQNAARGFANAGASIGGALINPKGSGEAASQITEGITAGVKNLSDKPLDEEEDKAKKNADTKKTIDGLGNMMGMFMGSGGEGMMGKSGGKGMMNKYGGKIKMEIGGPMPSSMGLNELTGPTHEEGGMAISPEVEVEGGETILEPASYVYSDSILVPGTKKTFAQASKAVKNKYKMREDDKLSQEAMNSELEALMNQQEEVKESMMIADTEKFQNKMMAKYGGSLMSDMYVDRNMQPMEMRKGGGIHIKPSKRGTFTAAAKKRGMGVQEFASKVMANKEDYSSAMVKKANFAKNAAKWKKQFGGFIEDEEMYGPVMMEDGGGMGVKKARGIMEFQNADMFEDPSKYEDIYQDENQLVLGEDTVDFKNERQARRFLNTLQSGKLNPPVENQLDLTNDNTEEKDSSFDFSKFKIPTTAFAGAAAAAKGLLGKNRFQNIPQATVNYINTRPAEVLAERQGELALAAGLGGLRDNATTQGNYLANVANLAAASGIGTGSNVANIRFQGDTQNLGIANQAALQRQATMAQNIDRLEKFRTAELLRRDKMADDFSRIGQTANLDQQKKQQQQYLLEAIARGVAKLDNKGRIMYKSTDDQGNSEWVYASELG